MRLTQTDRLHLFTAAYGRFCTLAANALHDGAAPRDVRNAMSSRALGPISDALMPIRDARATAFDLLADTKEIGLSNAVLVPRIHAVREAIEQEWEVDVPLVTA